jgi:UDP-3-O-[3-hydroxymyristoyl] glucosamine N-acyltransferase
MQYQLKQIAERIGGQLSGAGKKIIRGIAPFDIAGNDQITFAEAPKYIKRIPESRAGAVIVPADVAEVSGNLVRVKNPKVGFAKALELFHPSATAFEGISPQAVIGHQLRCGRQAAIAPLACIGNEVTIGDRLVCHPGVVIGDGVIIGDDVQIYPNVTIRENCRIGNRVILHAGVVVGSDGFGFAPDDGSYCKIPQVGFVQVDDDVEIGANTTVDRATPGKTWIQRGVKIDNLVHIGHNVTVGEDSVLVAQVIAGGSTTIGKHVIIAGATAIADHLTIGDGAIIGPCSGVGKPIAAGDIVSGAPHMPHRTWLRVHRVFPELPAIQKKVRQLEKQLQQLLVEDR